MSRESDLVKLSTGITEVIVKTVKKVAPKAEFDIETFRG